jgi:hypothetical protein
MKRRGMSFDSSAKYYRVPVAEIMSTQLVRMKNINRAQLEVHS